VRIYTIKISEEALSTHYYLREEAEDVADKLRKLEFVGNRVSVGAWMYELSKLLNGQDRIEIFEQIFLFKVRKPINNIHIFNVQVIEEEVI